MKNIVLLFVLLTGYVIGQTVSTIASIRGNDATGLPLKNNQVVTVAGKVVSSNQIGTTTIDDGTAGMAVFGNSVSNNVKIGDSIKITSTLVNYNGLAELNYTIAGSSFTKLDSNLSVTPIPVTIAQILGQTWNGVEEYESRLIRLKNVTITETGTFLGNKNYNISDSTGASMQIRIATTATTIVGTAIPTGKIDIIGVVGQFKSAAPFSSGYQVLPRFLTDFVYDNGPVILNSISSGNITSSSFTVYFNTLKNGNAKIKYGKTTGLEMDSITVNEDTTVHKITVTGLTANTKYYYRVYSTNSFGTSVSDYQTVSTIGTNSEVGTINVYFRMPIDSSVAMTGNAAKGAIILKDKLIDRINRANYSIDLALYSFTGLQDVVTALLAAKNRGVKIRLVYHFRTIQDNVQALLNNGIKMSQRPTDSGLMHNKFVVFDQRDSDPSNDWVWTGSQNVTDIELDWMNNAVEICDPQLASAYTVEFEEMWGSNTDTPNPVTAKFGSAKSNNTNHVFTIGNRPVKLYFSPSDGTNAQIINTINTSNKSIFYAVYSFTKDDIATAMYNRKQLGVLDIRGIIDQATGQGSEYNYMRNFSECLTPPSGMTTLHHKYMIVDSYTPESAPTTLTGSHNWSASAETDNDENTLIITDLKIANQFMQEFKKRYNDMGGTGTFEVPNGVDRNDVQEFSLNLYQNYPNPFNPVTTIRFETPVTQHVQVDVFNALGQQIGTLFDSEAKAGMIYAIDFKADSFGKSLASGVYYYRVIAGNTVQTKKMILNK